MKTRVFLKYFVRAYLWKRFFASTLPQAPSNLIHLTTLVTLKSFTQFQSKVKAAKLQKSVAKSENLFTEVQSSYCEVFEFGPGRSFRKIK